MRMRHVDICGLSGSTNFFPHYVINGTISEKKEVTEQAVCVFRVPLQLLSDFFSF